MKHKKTILLASVLIVSVGLDQWSKYWADMSLGTYLHPLPVEITDNYDGKTLGEVIQDKFDLSDEHINEIRERGPAGITILEPSMVPKKSDRAFPMVNGKARPASYWAFHHGSLDTPPRRVPTPRKAKGDLVEHGDKTIEEYLPYALPYLDKADLDSLLKDGLFYGALYRPIALNTRVAKGQTYLLMHRVVPLVPNFLQFKYAENPGAAWGFLADQEENFRKWFFMIVSLIAMTVISMLYHQLPENQRLASWAFAIILSGAVGNFIDRVRFNYVIDFIDMYVGDSHWPTYNVADIAITVGVVLLILEVVFNKDNAFLTATQDSSDPG